MDEMERYRIRESIKDVISILDSEPIRRDLMPDANLVQLTNRVPIAHLGIERGLKALIVEAGGSTKRIHGLHTHYRILKECDGKSAEFLALAFNDAVKFFKYNVNAKGFGQFRSLDDYLTRVGTDNAFEALRYWAIGETGKGESPMQFTCPLIHREILITLWCLFLPGRRETVSARVEREVHDAIFRQRHITKATDDTIKGHSLQRFMDWLKEHSTYRSVLEAAVRQNFAIEGVDEFRSQTLRDAYAQLQQTKDPAVIYFLRTLMYLPKGSQKRNLDAVPQLQWINQEQTFGMVSTPVGTCLGFIEKYPDGAWGIEPQEEGLVRISDIAESLADAKAYLVNRLTRQATLTLKGNSRPMRIISERGSFPPPAWYPDFEDPSELVSYEHTYELKFWDADHGISTGDEVSVELPDDEDHNFVSALKGTATAVAEHKVSVTGMVTPGSRDEIKC